MDFNGTYLFTLAYEHDRQAPYALPGLPRIRCLHVGWTKRSVSTILTDARKR